MDSRVEELALIIVERCEQISKGADRVSKRVDSSKKALAYGRIGILAAAILDEISSYRIDNPDEY